MLNTHFNVVDLIEGYNGAREIKIFDSAVELDEYSRRSGKIISESTPAAGPILRAVITRAVDGRLNRPLKVVAKRGGKAGGVRGGYRRGGGPSRATQLEDEDGRKRDTARSVARGRLVQYSLERSQM